MGFYYIPSVFSQYKLSLAELPRLSPQKTQGFALVALSTGDRPLAELMMRSLASLGGALDSATAPWTSSGALVVGLW